MPADPTDLPDAEAETRLSTALAAPPLDPALRRRLLALGDALAAEAPRPAGRIGFGRTQRWSLAAGVALAATLGGAAWLASADRSSTETLAIEPGVPDAAPGVPMPGEHELPGLRALASAAAAAGLPAADDDDSATVGTAEHRLAELEAAAGDPWARSAWAAVEADALFADGPASPRLF